MRSLGQRRMVGVGGCMLLAAFAAFAAFSVISHWAIAVVAIVALGYGFYMMHNTLQTLSSEMMPEVRGAAASGFAFCLFAGQAAGVFVLGHAIEAFSFESVFAAIGIALVLLGWRIAGRLAIAR
jgi:predicted MFS family arabinose efflux permease